MKKILVLFIAFCMLAVTGCKNGSTSEKTSESLKEEEKVDQNYYAVYEDEITAKFAATELKTFTDKMNGGNMQIYKYGDVPAGQKGYAVYLAKTDFAKENLKNFTFNGNELKYDGFMYVSDGDSVLVTSNYYRGISYGVYELLERNGVRFYASYKEGVYVPENGNVNYRISGKTVDNPDFEFRQFVNDSAWSDSPVLGEELSRMGLWLYRNRYNQTSELTWKGMENYGLSRCIVRHKLGFPNTSEHPEWQRTNADGVKTSDGNFCVSQKEALNFVANSILSEFENSPEMDGVQILGEDTYGGAWCYCDQCSKYSAHEQLAIVCNYAADKVNKIYPDAYVGYAMYHDTLNVSDVESFNDGVTGMFWPRETCYAHSMEDRDICSKNAKHYAFFADAVNKFSSSQYSAYYGDACLFNIMECNVCDQVAENLRLCKNMGVKDLSNLMFSELGTTLCDAQMITWNLLQWHVSGDYRSEVDNYYKNMFGATDEEAKKLFDLRYKFSREVFSFCGYSVDYGIEGVVMSNGEQDYGKQHAIEIQKAPDTMQEIIDMYKLFYERADTQDKKTVLNKKIIQGELSKLKSYSVSNLVVGAYLKKFVWDNDFTEPYRTYFQKGVDYELQAQELGKQYGNSIFGLNEYLIKSMGQNNVNYYRWNGDLL